MRRINAAKDRDQSVAIVSLDEFKTKSLIDVNITKWLTNFIEYKNILVKQYTPGKPIYFHDDTNVNPTVSINLRVVFSSLIDQFHDFIETPQLCNKDFWKYAVLFIIQVNYPTYIYYDTGDYNGVFTNLITSIIGILLESRTIHNFLDTVQTLYDNFERYFEVLDSDDNYELKGLKILSSSKSLHEIYSSYKNPMCYSICGSEEKPYLKSIEAKPYSLYSSRDLVDTNIGTDTTYCKVFDMLLTNNQNRDKAYVFSTIDAVNAESSSDTLALLAYRNICKNVIPMNTLANQVDASHKSRGFSDMNSMIDRNNIIGTITLNAGNLLEHVDSLRSQEIKLVDMNDNSMLFFTTTIEKTSGDKEITIEETREVISHLVDLLIESKGDPFLAFSKLSSQMITDFQMKTYEEILNFFSKEKYNTFCHNFRTALLNDFNDTDNNTPIWQQIKDVLQSKKSYYTGDNTNEEYTMDDYFNVLSNHSKRNSPSGSHFPKIYIPKAENFYKIKECFDKWWLRHFSNNKVGVETYNLCKTLFHLSFMLLFPVRDNTQGSSNSSQFSSSFEVLSPNFSSPPDFSSPNTFKTTLEQYKGKIDDHIFQAILNHAATSIPRIENNGAPDVEGLIEKLTPIIFKGVIIKGSSGRENDSDVVISTKITHGSVLLTFEELLKKITPLKLPNNKFDRNTYDTVKTFGSTKNPSVANISQRIRDIIHMYYGKSNEDNVKTNRTNGASPKTQEIMLELFHNFLFTFPDSHDEFCIRSKLIHSVMEQKTKCDPAQSLCGLHVNKYPKLQGGFASLLTFDTSAACVMRELWQIEQNYHLNISFIFTKPTPFIFPPNSFIPLFNALSCRKNKLNEGISVSSDIEGVLYHWKELLEESWLRKDNTRKNEFIQFIYTADNNPNACGEYLEQKVSEISYNQNLFNNGSNLVASGAKHQDSTAKGAITSIGKKFTGIPSGNRTTTRNIHIASEKIKKILTKAENRGAKNRVGRSKKTNDYDDTSDYEDTRSRSRDKLIPLFGDTGSRSHNPRSGDPITYVKETPGGVSTKFHRQNFPSGIFMGVTRRGKYKIKLDDDDHSIEVDPEDVSFTSKGGSRKHHRTPHNSVTRRKNKKSPKRKTIKKRKMPKRKNKTRRNK